MYTISMDEIRRGRARKQSLMLRASIMAFLDCFKMTQQGAVSIFGTLTALSVVTGSVLV